LRAELELLYEDLANKEKLLTTLQQAGASAPPKTESDLERYEAELNEMRRQLDAERATLIAELDILRERNAEMDSSIRDAEMQMSKERAELGRERIRLERMREDIKTDAERLQREMAVRDSMAPVQKLRDELLMRTGNNGKR
jgi:hypothetical protein